MMILVVYYFCTLTVNLRFLTNEKKIPEESDQFHFLRVVSYDKIKGSVGLILKKVSAMRISIPLDLSSRPLSLCHTLFVGDVLFHF
jgi:hypothetical protein